ncbi:MAG: DNA adenine methylase [Phycisphaerales bacterium]|nr:DNA adenine methylase [Phycisphaerales bacterium]
MAKAHTSHTLRGMPTLFTPTHHDFERFPATRYQGSKRRSAEWIVERLADLEYRTVLDAFGGTGSVAFAFKCAGKQVTCNDLLRFNHRIGLALIENRDVRLEESDIDFLLAAHEGVRYDDFIQRTFQGVYFTDDENALLDRLAVNLAAVRCPFKQALSSFAVFQAAIAKRPYNLFHRANLYMRLADVERTFGNKATWDTPFEAHLRAFAREANDAVFDNGLPCRAVCADALEIEPGFDLVYIDPPYVSASGVGVDYREFYHFLEGLVRYEEWPMLIDATLKHRPLARKADPWARAETIADCFTRLFDRFRGSILAVSYRSNGIPSVEALEALLRERKRHVVCHARAEQPYALSTDRATREVLLVGWD